MAALLTGGCESERARVDFAFFPHQGIDPAVVTIRFDDGSRDRVLTGEDFTGDAFRMDSRAFETRTSGTLRVEVTLAGGGEATASGSVDLPLRSDWAWSVQLHRGAENPTETCLGCFGYRAFAATGAPADSLWIVWGGNSISNPVVY